MDVRHVALKCLIKILEQSRFYEETFNLYAKEVTNPAELTNLVAGAVKHKGTLDYYIGKISSRNIKRLSPEVRNILRLGIYELEYLKKLDYAAVSSYVELCKDIDKKSAAFVNAILRNFIRKKDRIMLQRSELSAVKYFSLKHSHPEWIIQNWINSYGEDETEKICEYNNKPPKLSLRVNTLKISVEKLIKLFEKHEIEFEKSLFNKNSLIIKNSGNIRKLPGYEEGFWVVQGESSSMVCEVLDPQPGEKILDFCAAPGVKTVHIATFMGNTGRITAVDVSLKRIKRITENCKRLGVEIVETVAKDARNVKFEESFDRILVDAPCSNTGVFAARPDARWQKKPEDIDNLSVLQLELLQCAAQFLKPDGILVYSTCSIEPEENELLIKSFLNKNEDFILEKFRPADAFEEAPGILQILQSKHNIDGFFIAKLRKTSDIITKQA